MDIHESVRNRRSIRKFLDKPVPQKTLQELVSNALWSPSWGNTQPWEFILATGEPLERFKKANRSALLSGKKPTPEIPMPSAWPNVMKARYVHIGRSVLDAQSIDRKDMDGRLKYYGDMFSLFGAQALLLLMLDKNLLIEYAMLDIGLFLQTFMLLTHARGLGSIALAASVNYPGILRDHFPIPIDRRIVMGVAVGWPDPNAPVNQFQRKRAAFDDCGIWIN